MATRFLAIISRGTKGVGKAAAEIEAESGLLRVIDTPDMALFTDFAAHHFCLPDNRGAVIGDLFSGVASPERIRESTPELFQQIVHSRAQHLIDACWGGYVAIVRDNEGETHILRDPSGAMPCYYLETSSATVIFSDVETMLAAGFQVPAIDWSYMLRHLLAYDLRSPGTGLTGVEELLAGFRLTLTRSAQVVTQCWSPWDHVCNDRTATSQKAATDLHETVTTAVRAWAGSFSHILLGVSGGLDSSILAACLTGQPTHLTCLTMATDEADGDERRYARILSAALDLTLLERHHDLGKIDITRSTAAHLPRPLLYAFGQSEHEAKFAIARAHGIDAFFSGIGGDNVFCHMVSPSPVIDRLRAQGLRGGVFTTIDDICKLTGCSFWELAKAGIPRLMAKRSSYRWVANTRFINRAAASDFTEVFTHPWLDAPADALPGKAAHVAMLTRIQGTIDGFSRLEAPPQINPLLSQPIVEACLHIPTWQWCEGGQNRSVARLAFREDLPARIVNRRSKGGPDSFAFDVIEANRALLREQLLEGVLAQRGLLDLKALENCLDTRRWIQRDDYVRLSAIAETEAWVRHWEGLGYQPKLALA
jgi:asparagine synthase (glutamine-hydrolysing)